MSQARSPTLRAQIAAGGSSPGPPHNTFVRRQRSTARLLDIRRAAIVSDRRSVPTALTVARDDIDPICPAPGLRPRLLSLHPRAASSHRAPHRLHIASAGTGAGPSTSTPPSTVPASATLATASHGGVGESTIIKCTKYISVWLAINAKEGRQAQQLAPASCIYILPAIASAADHRLRAKYYAGVGAYARIVLVNSHLQGVCPTTASGIGLIIQASPGRPRSLHHLQCACTPAMTQPRSANASSATHAQSDLTFHKFSSHTSPLMLHCITGIASLLMHHRTLILHHR